MNSKDVAKLIYDFTTRNKSAWENGSIRFETIIDQTHIDFIHELDKYEYSDYQIKRNGNNIGTHQLKIGDFIEITITPPRQLITVFFAKNLEDLLSSTSLISPPENIIVHNQQFVSWENAGVIPHNIVAYKELCNFLSNLIKLDIVEKSRDDELIFFSSGQSLKINVKTRAQLLDSNATKITNSCKQILEKLHDVLHLEEKKRIFRVVLYSYLKNQNKAERLSHFIEYCDSIQKEFTDNYYLFVAEFPFDSKIEELKKLQQDYSNKICSILSSIQTKILAIPLSLILAFGQMKSSPDENPLLINTGIVLAALIFSILIWYLLSSQEKILLPLKEEIDSKKSRFKGKLSNLYGEFVPILLSLNGQYENTKKMIYFLKILVVGGVIATVLAYIFMTPNIRNLF